MMKKILLAVVILISALKAQENEKDYLYLSDDKKYFLAAIEAIGTNVGVWGVNRFILNEDWARISPDTWKRNLNSNFVFDNDPFEINQFLHPYHGSLYFTSARSNNLTFWESVPYTIGGSLIWEYFGETTLPSRNDLIGTTMGGIALGEILFRLSNMVLDESASGSERFWRETGAFFISPIHGFNRLINGRAFQTGKRKSNPKNSTELAVGINNIAKDNVFADLSSQLYLRLRIYYGNIHRDVPIHNAYSNFSVLIGGNISKNSRIPEVLAQGILVGKNLSFTDRHSSVAGLFQHYNYVDWAGNQISSHALTGGIENEFYLTKDFKIWATLHLGYTVLGGSNLFFKNNEKIYNFSNGYTGKTEFALVSEDFGRLFFSYYPYWFNIIHPVEGEEFIGVLTAEYDFPVFSTYGLGIEYKLYRRWGEYSQGNSVSDNTSAVRAFVRITLD